MVIGIDIGTSFSSVAIIRNGKAEALKHEANMTSIPSAVFIQQDGTRLIGQTALNSRMSDPARFRDNFKRDFGTDKPYLLGGEEITPDEIYTEYFSFFKRRVEEYTGEDVTKAYITHPVAYSAGKKLLLRKAAEYAGLDNIVLVDEPTAAARSFFAEHALEKGQTLLIYDFGGGTLDLTLVEKTADGFRPLTDPIGVGNCGGADFDKAIYQDIVEQLSKQTDLMLALTKSRFCLTLNEVSVKAKVHLSYATSFSDEIPCLGDYRPYTLTREHFNALIADKVNLSCSLIKDIARNAGMTPVQIDKVLCVGGSTRIPYIRDCVGNAVNKSVLTTADPELSVCMGAVMMEIAGNGSDKDSKDCIDSGPEASDCSDIKGLIAKGTAIIDMNTRDGELVADNGTEYILEALKYYVAAAEKGNATACYLASQILLRWLGETELAAEYGPQVVAAREPNSLCSMMTFHLYSAYDRETADFIRDCLNEQSILSVDAVPEAFDTSASARLYLGLQALSKCDARKAAQYLQKSAAQGNIFAEKLLELTNGANPEHILMDKIMVRAWSLFKGKPKFVYPSDANFNSVAAGVCGQYRKTASPLFIYTQSAWGFNNNGFAVFPDGIGYRNSGSAAQFLSFADMDLHDVDNEDTFVTLGTGRYIEINMQSILGGVDDFIMALMITKLLSWFTCGLI